MELYASAENIKMLLTAKLLTDTDVIKAYTTVLL